MQSVLTEAMLVEAVNRSPQRQADNMGTALDNSPQQNVASVALAS